MELAAGAVELAAEIKVPVAEASAEIGELVAEEVAFRSEESAAKPFELSICETELVAGLAEFKTCGAELEDSSLEVAACQPPEQ